MVLHNYTTYYLIAILFNIGIVIFLWLREKFKYWQKRDIPFIQPVIPFGNTLDLFLGRITFGELFSKAYLEFKKRGLKHGGIFYLWKPIYVPVDDEIIKKILISDFENFPNHGFYISTKDQPLTANVFNMEDNRWKSVRAKFPAAFTTAKMRRMFLIMDKFSDKFVELLARYAENGVALEIKSEVTKFTTDIISACAFGIESKTLENQNTELLNHGRSFFDYQWDLLKNTFVVMVPRNILQKFKFKVFTNETEHYITTMFEKIKKFRESDKTRRNDLADIIVNMTKVDGHEKDFSGKTLEPLSIEEYVAQMYVFFSAGFETSSSTQTFAIYELSKNPTCQKILRDEITYTLAKHDNKVTYDAVMEMKYLDNVVNETLRLYPVFPILPRVCNKDYQIPGTSTILEKNTLTLVTNLGIQRDPEYYPNPEQFDPDRFLPSNKADRPFISYVPFGEGPRICVGKRFGLLQSKLGLINIIRNFEVTLNERTIDGMKFVYRELILRKAGDVWVNLKRLS